MYHAASSTKHGIPGGSYNILVRGPRRGHATHSLVCGVPFSMNSDHAFIGLSCWSETSLYILLSLRLNSSKLYLIISELCWYDIMYFDRLFFTSLHLSNNYSYDRSMKDTHMSKNIITEFTWFNNNVLATSNFINIHEKSRIHNTINRLKRGLYMKPHENPN